MHKIMHLENEATWPPELLRYLEDFYDLFINWKLHNERVQADEFDSAVEGLNTVLHNDYVLHGYHCTRLTAPEIQEILKHGMQLPNLEFLHARICNLVRDGSIDALVAEYLKHHNQAADDNRAGMLWFCFFPLHIAGQSGVSRFFRSWGGEALYNSHEDDDFSGPILRKIGTPCLVEAYVPLASLKGYSYDFRVIHQFLVNRGATVEHDPHHADRSRRPIPASHIVRVIQYPDPDFITLTGCNTWHSEAFE